MAEKITGILIDVEHEIAHVVTINRELEEYYKLLNCQLIEIVSRKIGNRIYDIICDEEGALKDKPKISAINDLGMPILVGNLFIVNYDGIDNEISLTQSDIDYIMPFIQKQATRKYPRPYPMLQQCDHV